MFFSKKKEDYIPSVQDQRIVVDFWKSSLEELEREFYNPKLMSMWPEKYNDIGNIVVIIK